jgi:hypothetical protein
MARVTVALVRGATPGRRGEKPFRQWKTGLKACCQAQALRTAKGLNASGGQSMRVDWNSLFLYRRQWRYGREPGFIVSDIEMMKVILMHY